MSNNETRKILDDLHDIDVNDLTGRAKDLFDAIMKIADERDNLLKENEILRINAEHNDKVVDDIRFENQQLKAMLDIGETCAFCPYYKLRDQLKQRDEVIDEAIKYITSYEAIHTFQFGDEVKEDIEMNSQFDEKTFNELQRRYLIIHHKLLEILQRYKGDNK